jgi:hypothetical protein
VAGYTIARGRSQAGYFIRFTSPRIDDAYRDTRFIRARSAEFCITLNAGMRKAWSGLRHRDGAD